MHSWREFKEEQAELAQFGQQMLYQFGPGLGFLATTRRDGGPRVHPVCPIIEDDELYVMVMPRSPKRFDLERDRRYALHSFPAEENDDEFFCAGAAERIDEADVWRRVSNAAEHDVKPHEILFRLLLDRALHTTWADPRTPEMRPIYTTWRAD